MSTDTAISVKNLSKKFKRFNSAGEAMKEFIHPFGKRYHNEFWALKDVSFEIKKGESIGLIGRNGSGKSTLLQILCGILQPTVGTLSINGKIAALLELGAGFHPQFSGRDNVYLNGAIMGFKKEEMDEKFASIVEFADIGDFIDQPVMTYSSGMFVRLAFAVSVHVDPEILIVDEALSVGDIGFQQKCLNHIESLMKRGVTLIMVSHDIHIIKNYCTRALYLDRGDVIAYGEVETVTEAYLKDFNATRNKSFERKGAVSWKKERAGKASYGTADGDIYDMSLQCGEEDRDCFRQGEAVTVRITARVRDSVKNPDIVIQLRDSRGYAIYGTDTLANGVSFPQQQRVKGVIGAAFTFDVVLAPGSYSIAVGLNDHISDTIIVAHDKVVGALNFTVLESPKRFHGVVDLKASCLGAVPGPEELKNIEALPPELPAEQDTGSKALSSAPVYGEYDIGEEGLAAALGKSPTPELLGDLVRLSRERFGWFTRQETRALEIPWVIVAARDISGKQILDIGAGVSPLPLYLAQKGATVKTVDHSEIIRVPGKGQRSWDEWGFLDYELLDSRITSSNEDILAIDLPEGSLDCAYSVSVVEHMPASVRKKIWQRLARWLKKDGVVLLTVDLVPGTDKLWNYSMGKVVEDEKEHGVLEELEAEFREIGFKKEESEFIRGLGKSRVDVCMLRLVRDN